MRISDWSSDVCSSDLPGATDHHGLLRARGPQAAQHFAVVAVLEHDAAVAMPQRQAIQRGHHLPDQIGRASCRERVCQYVEISVVAVTLKKKKKNNKIE